MGTVKAADSNDTVEGSTAIESTLCDLLAPLELTRLDLHLDELRKGRSQDGVARIPLQSPRLMCFDQMTYSIRHLKTFDPRIQPMTMSHQR